MKRLLFFAFLATTAVAHAQTITIGEGSGMTTQLPFNSFYNFSFTEQIYLASEIQFAGYIKAISFRIAYSYNIGSVADIDVYLKNVSRNSFSDATDYEPVSSDDLVFSGEWEIPADTDDWITITFDTPFRYNGADNLLIAIDENSSDYAIRYFRCSDVIGATLSYSDDNQNPDPFGLDTFDGYKELVNQRANTKLVFQYNYGVEEDGVTSLSVYPNPAKDFLYIEGADGETVAIYDVFGRLIKQETYNAGLNISGLEKGVYAVKIKTGVLRFVKE